MPTLRHHTDPSLISLKQPDSFAAEQYQGLRLTMEQMKALRDTRVIAITSPCLGDGKTVTSINLATALSRGGNSRVLLVDADLRRPAVASRLGVAEADAAGLVEAITGPDMTLQTVSRLVPGSALHIVPSGVVRAPVHEILRSPQLEALLTEARRHYDFIVLDAPPLLPVFDAALLSRAVDGVLVVVAANRTPRRLLGEALNQLDPSKVLGIIFNGDARPLFGYYDSSYQRYFRES
jgi:capsular exopolysaccharide synthesis family protein